MVEFRRRTLPPLDDVLGCHVDSCELRSAKGKLHVVLAIDRVSKSGQSPERFRMPDWGFA